MPTQKPYMNVVSRTVDLLAAEKRRNLELLAHALHWRGNRCVYFFLGRELLL